MQFRLNIFFSVGICDSKRICIIRMIPWKLTIKTSFHKLTLDSQNRILTIMKSANDVSGVKNKVHTKSDLQDLVQIPKMKISMNFSFSSLLNK